MNQMMIIGLALAMVAIVLIWNFVIRRQFKPLTRIKKPIIRQTTPSRVEPAPLVVRSLRVPEPMPMPVSVPEVEPIKRAPELPAGKYQAMVWTETNGVVFKKIPYPIGPLVHLDPSMPSRGAHYAVEEISNPDGSVSYRGVDPREIPIVSEETPEWAFDSIHCFKYVYAWFKNKSDAWDHVNTVLIGLAIVAMFIMALAAIDKAVR